MAVGVLSAANRDYAGKLLGPRFVDIAKKITENPGAGLSFIKLSEDLTEARAIAFSLEACGMRNSQRTKSLKRLCSEAGQDHAFDRLSSALALTRRHLGLLRTPLRHIGLEIASRDVCEIKAYFHGNIKNERIDGDHVAHDPTEMTDEIEMIRLVGAELDLSDDVIEHAVLTVETGWKFGLGLDMIGIDVALDGSIGLKTYLAPPEGVEGIHRRQDRKSVAGLLDAITAGDESLASKDFIEAVADVKGELTLNQVSVEISQAGPVALKLYYDLWHRHKTFTESAAAPLSFEEFARMRTSFEQAGAQLPGSEALSAWEEQMAKGEMALDAFCLELLDGAARCKVYVRPEGNQNGDGLAWQGEAVDV